MPLPRNHYQTLQVDPAAEPEVITAAYKRLSLKYHPDTNPSPEATLHMQEINEAYQILISPSRRRQYDLLLQRTNDSHAPSSTASQPHRPPPRPAPSSSWRQMVASLVFPLTYSLAAFFLFRFFRGTGIISIAIVLILSGVIAYYISSAVTKELKK